MLRHFIFALRSIRAEGETDPVIVVDFRDKARGSIISIHWLMIVALCEEPTG